MLGVDYLDLWFKANPYSSITIYINRRAALLIWAWLLHFPPLFQSCCNFHLTQYKNTKTFGKNGCKFLSEKEFADLENHVLQFSEDAIIFSPFLSVSVIIICDHAAIFLWNQGFQSVGHAVCVADGIVAEIACPFFPGYVQPHIRVNPLLLLLKGQHGRHHV